MGNGQTVIDLPAEVSGAVRLLKCKVGDEVMEGQELVILESMKMEIPVVAPEDGTVEGIHVEGGQAVAPGDPIVSLKVST